MCVVSYLDFDIVLPHYRKKGEELLAVACAVLIYFYYLGTMM